MKSYDLDTAADTQAARKRVDSEIDRLTVEREQVIEQSTEQRLARIDEALRTLRNDQYEVSKAENRLREQSEPTVRETELTEQIKEACRQERRLMADAMEVSRGLPAKFIRVDAFEHFEQERDMAEKEAEKLRASRRTKLVRPDSYDLSIEDLEKIVKEWPQTKKLCRLGADIAEQRELAQTLTAERDSLREQRHKQALAA